MYDHLRSNHSPDSYYACDFCEYATTIKSNIIMHMHTHGNPKSYKCDKCPYIALHINIMKEHVTGHGVGSTFHEEAVTKKAKPVILLKCSECGFTTDERSILNDHMLKHISDIHLLASAKSQESSAHDTATITPAGKGKDQPTAYVCKECDFMSTEAYVFMTHTLSHKAKQGSQVVPTVAGKSSTVTAATTYSTAKSHAMTSPSSQSLSIEPVDLSKQWTHDSSIGMYRCMICGYFTKHQRTIKSHIWKHSGHKDIDYPMFQNGPLSVYDDIPIGKTTLISTNNVIQMQKDNLAEGNKDTKGDEEEEEDPAKKDAVPGPADTTLEKEGEVIPSLNTLKTTGAGKKPNTIVEMKSAQITRSSESPKTVQITVPSLGGTKSTSAGIASSTATVPNSTTVSSTPRIVGQVPQPLSAQKRPTIQIVDRSQKPKQPVTVLVSKQSSEQKQVILLTTGSGKEQTDGGKFPGKIHKMIPIQKSEGKSRINVENLNTQTGNRPVLFIQRRNSAPVEGPKPVISVVTSASGSSDGNTQVLVSSGKQKLETQRMEPAIEEAEETGVSDSAVNTSMEDAELYDGHDTSQDASENKGSIITRLRKRRLEFFTNRWL